MPTRPLDVSVLLKQAFSEYAEDKVPRLSAALAYYTVFSLAPMIVLSVVLLGFVVDDPRNFVETQLGSLMGSVGKDAATQMITNAKQSSGVMATIISTIILIFGASGVFGELQDSMNTIWEVQLKPNQGWMDWIKRRFFSMALVFGIIFLLIVSLVVSTALAGIAHRLAGEGKVVGFIVDVIASLIIYTLLFAATFRFLPDVKVAWRDVWLGAGITSVLFLIGKYLLSLYLAKASPASAFGAAGSLAALLIWVYYSAQILFFGAEITQVYANEYGSKIVPDEGAEFITREKRAEQGIPHGEDKPTPVGGRYAPGWVAAREYVERNNSGSTMTPITTLAAGLIVGRYLLGKKKFMHEKLTPEQLRLRIGSRLRDIGIRKSYPLDAQKLADDLLPRDNESLRPWWKTVAERFTHHEPETWGERIKEKVSDRVESMTKDRGFVYGFKKGYDE
jgi:membrane protein